MFFEIGGVVTREVSFYTHSLNNHSIFNIIVYPESMFILGATPLGATLPIFFTPKTRYEIIKFMQENHSPSRKPRLIISATIYQCTAMPPHKHW